MSVTHGGPNKGKRFQWKFNATSGRLEITNQNGRELRYTLQEIHEILLSIQNDFGSDYFPLANNVERLSNGTERNGLGMIILRHKPGEISHAQGASYLGVVLEERGFLEWNGKHRGIEWRLKDKNLGPQRIKTRLS
jgi:hypothetical protein